MTPLLRLSPSLLTFVKRIATLSSLRLHRTSALYSTSRWLSPYIQRWAPWFRRRFVSQRVSLVWSSCGRLLDCHPPRPLPVRSRQRCPSLCNENQKIHQWTNNSLSSHFRDPSWKSPSFRWNSFHFNQHRSILRLYFQGFLSWSRKSCSGSPRTPSRYVASPSSHN